MRRKKWMKKWMKKKQVTRGYKIVMANDLPSINTYAHIHAHTHVVIELKNRVSAPAHPSRSGFGRISDLVANSRALLSWINFIVVVATFVSWR